MILLSYHQGSGLAFEQARAYGVPVSELSANPPSSIPSSEPGGATVPGGGCINEGGAASHVSGAEANADGRGDRAERESGVGPWPGGRESWPDDPRFDPELLESGDRRNVEDHYRYWTVEAIAEDVATHSIDLEIAIENLGHDFNIGSIVRSANAMGVRAVHIVGRRRWNRRGAMVTDRYVPVDHMSDPQDLATYCRERGVALIGVDNVQGSWALEQAVLPNPACLVFGEESGGLSAEMQAVCERIVHITQRGSTRSMNVGHAAAIAMWAWVIQHEQG